MRRLVEAVAAGHRAAIAAQFTPRETLESRVARYRVWYAEGLIDTDGFLRRLDEAFALYREAVAT